MAKLRRKWSLGERGHQMTYGETAVLITRRRYVWRPFFDLGCGLPLIYILAILALFSHFLTILAIFAGNYTSFSLFSLFSLNKPNAFPTFSPFFTFLSANRPKTGQKQPKNTLKKPPYPLS